MKINWNLLGGGGVQNKNPSMGGVGLFSGTVQKVEVASTFWSMTIC